MTRIFDALLRRLGRWSGFRWYVILIQPLTVSMGTHATPEGLAIRQVTAEELLKASNSPHLAISGEFLAAAQQRGDLCFAAFKDEDIVAYTWRARHWAPHDDVGVIAAKPYVYGYKGMTLPDWRGHRLNAIVNHYANSIYLSEGYTHMVTFTGLENRKSRRAMTAASGYEKIGYTAYLPLKSKLLQYRSRAVKASGLRFGEAES